MCEQDQFTATGHLSRRGFARVGAIVGAGAALTACTTSGMTTGAVSETAVSIDAPGGTLDGFFYAQDSMAHPAILMWPDIAGVRPAKRMMARRLAEAGYAVLLGNPYYRSVAGQQFADFDDFRANDGFAKVAPWRERHTPENVMAVVRAAVGWLDAQGPVDSTRGIGTQGYCMTGGWALTGLAAVPGRIKGASSFHGAGLVGDDPLAPVNLFGRAAENAQALIAIGRNDDAGDPQEKTRLRAAADAAGLDAEIEVYNADHGWTVPDSPVYDEPEAERAWANLLELYSDTL